MAGEFSWEGKRKISAARHVEEQSKAPGKPRLPSESSEESWDTGSEAKMQRPVSCFPQLKVIKTHPHTRKIALKKPFFSG